MCRETRANILAVDDEASNLNILNQILKERYNIFAAKSGKAALKIAAEKKPELILLDMILPDISGYEVLSELKGQDSTRGIPVIIITALDSEKNKQTGFELGAAEYITKPFGSADVKEKVEACLNRNR